MLTVLFVLYCINLFYSYVKIEFFYRSANSSSHACGPYGEQEFPLCSLLLSTQSLHRLGDTWRFWLTIPQVLPESLLASALGLGGPKPLGSGLWNSRKLWPEYLSAFLPQASLLWTSSSPVTKASKAALSTALMGEGLSLLYHCYLCFGTLGGLCYG